MFKNVRTKKGWLLLGIILLTASLIAAFSSPDGTETKTDAFGSAGGRVSSTNFETVFILGQSSPPDVSESSNFRNIGGFLATFGIVGTKTVSLDFPQGWNWISINVIPPDPDMEIVWQDVANLKIVKGYGGFFIPGVWNGIGDWNVKEMYVPYVDPADQLLVQGQPVDPATPIELQQNWNWVSYLPDVAINAEVALASIVDDLNIAKAYGGFYIPGLWNGIGDMQLGQGYKLHLKQACTLIYPSEGSMAKLAKAKVLPKAEPMPGEHFVVNHQTDDYYSILVTSVRIDGKEAEVGDELGIFAESNLCVGSVLLQGEFPVGVMAWADDPQTEKVDGFKQGEAMVFKVWDVSEDQECKATASYIQGDGKFGSSAFASVSLEGRSPVLLPESYDLGQNYPNPFNPETTINYQLPEAGRVVLKIYNTLGQEIRTLVSEEKEAGYHEARWDGKDDKGVAVSSGVYVYRIQSGEFVKARKMLFLR